MARQKVSQALGLVDHRPDAAAQCMDEEHIIGNTPPGKRLLCSHDSADHLLESILLRWRIICSVKPILKPPKLVMSGKSGVDEEVLHLIDRGKPPKQMLLSSVRKQTREK
eukprot:1166018-Amphidinium_carterae.1